ncbi:LRR domain containing protein, partial [Parasponia andersonii]
SLFQQARHSELFFKMHDLVNDLAKFVSGEFCSRLDNKTSPTIVSKTRYLSFVKRNVKDIQHFEALFDAKRLRTFLPLGWRKETEQFLLNNLLLHELLRKVLCLRVLSLSEYLIVELPDSIGNLKQLRHLTQLPTNMGDLINLRYLYIEMPHEMYKMKNLQALTDFVLGEHSGSSITQLRELQQLRGYLCISGLQNVIDVKDVVEAKLKDKRGTRFPDWVGDYMFSNITVVSLSNCKNCCLLPPLGQLPSLRKLDIRGFNGVVKIGAEFYSNGSFASRPFGSLEVLRFGDMPEWKEWSFIGSEDGLFPRLKELYLRDCPKLIVVYLIIFQT